MFRRRFRALTVATGIGLACGCMSFGQHPLMGRFHHEAEPTDCCGVEAIPDGMPVQVVPGAVLPAPQGPGLIPNLPPQGVGPSPNLPPQDLNVSPDRLTPVPTAPRSTA